MTIPESGGGGEYGDHPRPAFRSSRLFYLKKRDGRFLFKKARDI
jgi:hypothetical protein